MASRKFGFLIAFGLFNAINSLPSDNASTGNVSKANPSNDAQNTNDAHNSLENQVEIIKSSVNDGKIAEIILNSKGACNDISKQHQSSSWCKHD